MIGKLNPPISVSLPQAKDLWAALLQHRRMAFAAGFLLLAALAGGVILARRDGGAPAYQTQLVTRGDLAQSVTASGTVNPQDTVSVGTQVSGTINALYVDFNSKVKKGQVLARLDPSQLQAQLQQAQADFGASAGAGGRAIADCRRSASRNHGRAANESSASGHRASCAGGYCECGCQRDQSAERAERCAADCVARSHVALFGLHCAEPIRHGSIQ